MDSMTIIAVASIVTAGMISPSGSRFRLAKERRLQRR